jgi:hypothetical protein
MRTIRSFLVVVVAGSDGGFDIQLGDDYGEDLTGLMGVRLRRIPALLRVDE